MKTSAESSGRDTWVYFTVRAKLKCNEYERVLGDSGPDEQLSVVLPHAHDMLVAEDLSQPVEIFVPICIYFRMKKADADTVTDAALKLALEEHFRRYCASLAAMEDEEGGSLDILERVESVSISDITRSIDPSQEHRIWS
jgi:hypothetical protein